MTSMVFPVANDDDELAGLLVVGVVVLVDSVDADESVDTEDSVDVDESVEPSAGCVVDSVVALKCIKKC